MKGALRLPLSFDAGKLGADLERIEGKHHWHSHPDYTVAEEGDWTAIALVSGSGSYEGAASLKYTGGDGMPTALLKDAAYLREVIYSFRTRVHRVRLMNLKPGTRIREHRDYGVQRYSFERGFIRVHVPIRTHEKVAWRLRGVKVPMQPGEAWYLNVCLPHSVENFSDVSRVHLVLDMEVNDWVKALFPKQDLADVLFATCIKIFEPRYLKAWRRSQPLYWRARSAVGDFGLRKMRDLVRERTDSKRM